MSRPGMQNTEVMGFWQNVVPGWAFHELLFFAADRRLADIIGDGPTELEEIARQSATHPQALRRLLNALAANGIFKRVGNTAFAATPLSNPLRSDASDSQRAYVALGRIILHEAWGSLEGTMETERSAFGIRFGAPTFEYMKSNPKVGKAFAEGMTSTTRRIEQGLMAADPFGNFQTVVDVGGSFGSLVRLLLARQPSARGVVFDRPEVAEEAARRWSGSPDANRLLAIGGSFFDQVPSGGDLYLLKQILHDWPDDQCVDILRNVRAAMRPNARIAIVEMVLPDDGSQHPGWMYDILMMTMTGGRERTAQEYQRLLQAAGFSPGRLIPTGAALSVIEAKPPAA
jgi:hypothetical protein